METILRFIFFLLTFFSALAVLYAAGVRVLFIDALDHISKRFLSEQFQQMVVNSLQFAV